MKRWKYLLIVSCVLCVGCGPATPELGLLEEAAEAMGSLRAVSETTGVILEGSGRTYRLGQNQTPRADLPYYEIENYRLAIDFANQRWQLRQDRTTTFFTGNPLFGVRQTFGLDGDVAYDEGDDDGFVQASDRVASQRRAELYHNPLGIILLGLDETSTASNLRDEGGDHVVDIAAADGAQFTLYVDADTLHPSRVVSTRYDTMLGDVTYETIFEDYAESGGLGGFQARLTLPRQYTINLGEDTIAEYRVTSDTQAQIGDLSVSAAPPPSDEVTVESEEVANGVWRLAGGSHHSGLVEFDDFLALIEAPQSEARTLAVIEHARGLVPDKPLQYVVNTHHHFDHSAGIRAAVSEGLTVITHEINAPFFEDLVARQHTIEQDALARNPQPLNIETVNGDEVYELSNGRRTLQISRIVGDRHSDGIVMAYLPATRERILFEVDSFTPGASAAPFAAALLENIEEKRLRINTIVPLHGPGTASLDDLEEAVEQEGRR